MKKLTTTAGVLALEARKIAPEGYGRAWKRPWPAYERWRGAGIATETGLAHAANRRLAVQINQSPGIADVGYLPYPSYCYFYTPKFQRSRILTHQGENNMTSTCMPSSSPSESLSIPMSPSALTIV